MNKLFLWVMMALLGVFSVYGLCESIAGTTEDAADYTSMLYNVNRNIPVEADSRILSISEITPRLNITITKCVEYNITNGTTTTLKFKQLRSTIKVYNSTGATKTPVMSAGNYTYTASAGTIYWNKLTIAKWNNTEVLVCYNKTYVKNLDDLTNGSEINSGAAGYSATFNTWDVNSTWKVTDTDFNNTGWVLTWNYESRDCSAQTSCDNTRLVIFAGFGLLAVAALVLAAFLIIKMIEGGAIDFSSMSAVAIGVIALGIVLTLAYFIISQVGNAVCSV